MDANGCSISESILVTSVKEEKGARYAHPNPCAIPCLLRGDFQIGDYAQLLGPDGGIVVEQRDGDSGILDLGNTVIGVYLIRSKSSNSAVRLIICWGHTPYPENTSIA